MLNGDDSVVLVHYLAGNSVARLQHAAQAAKQAQAPLPVPPPATWEQLAQHAAAHGQRPPLPPAPAEPMDQCLGAQLQRGASGGGEVTRGPHGCGDLRPAGEPASGFRA